MCMQSISIHLSLIKSWITMNLLEQSYKYQEGTTISIISLMIFNCLGRSKKELPPHSPRRHLTCSHAGRLLLPPCPSSRVRKKDHHADNSEGAEGAEGRTDPPTLKKDYPHPCEFPEWLLMKEQCQVDQNTHCIPSYSTLVCPAFPLVEKPTALLSRLAVHWHSYHLFGFFPT